MDGLFPNIFHGERSELREKYGLRESWSSGSYHVQFLRHFRQLDQGLV